MKTSNKIIISIAAVIFIGTLLLFITAKQHEVVMQNIQTKFFPLKPFSVIVVENGSVCRIRSLQNVTNTETNEKGLVTRTNSEMHVLKVYYNPEKRKNIDRMFIQKGDTLYIYAGAKVSVETSGKIKSIIGHQHELLFLEGVKTESIQLVGGKTNIAALSANNKSMYIDISSNAVVNCDFFEIDSFKIISDSSEINFPFGNVSSSSKLLNAKLKRNSKLCSLDRFEVVTIEKDKSSTQNITNSMVYTNFLNDFDKIEP